jgi:histone deacetylase 8
VNDCVLALLALRRAPVPAPRRGARVLYVDVDLHLADGVQAAFHVPDRAGPANILTLSLHHSAPGFFPPPLSPNAPSSPTGEIDLETAGDPFTLGAPLRAHASARTYARLWVDGVERVARVFAPDVLVLQCGADALAGDPCRVGNWCIGGEGGMGWCVARAMGWGCKVLLLGGGALCFCLAAAIPR